jgi:hypothetical protein
LTRHSRWNRRRRKNAKGVEAEIWVASLATKIFDVTQVPSAALSQMGWWLRLGSTY